MFGNPEKHTNNIESNDTTEIRELEPEIIKGKELNIKITKFINAIDAKLLSNLNHQYNINKDSSSWSGLNPSDKLAHAAEEAYKQLDNRNQENLDSFMVQFIPLVNELVINLKENNEDLQGRLTIITNKESFDKIISNNNFFDFRRK